MRSFAGVRKQAPAEYVAGGLTNGPDAIDYQGVIFDDGSVAVRWLTQFRSTSVWSDWASFYHVHGHPEYDTVIKFNDHQPMPEV